MAQNVVKRRYLPSLGSLATFEVAAKHLSFTLAANELHVTQAAISQQIRALEKELACVLFRRKHHALELTPEGQVLLDAVNHGLDHLSNGIMQIGRRASNNMITICATHAGILYYVKPLTDKFCTMVPGLRFCLLAADENNRIQDFEEVNIAIIYGNERTEIGQHLIFLFEEVVYPVCSPAYLQRNGSIIAVEDIASASLLELHSMHWQADSIAWYPLDWSCWFRQYLASTSLPEPIFITNSYSALVDAAEKGQGLILGWQSLVQAAILEGRLIHALDAPLYTGRSIYLKVNRNCVDHPYIEHFISFLLAENQKMGLHVHSFKEK